MLEDAISKSNISDKGVLLPEQLSDACALSACGEEADTDDLNSLEISVSTSNSQDVGVL